MEAVCGEREKQRENELNQKLQEELLSQVYESLPDFKREGVEKDRIKALLSRLRTLSPDALCEQFELTEESLEMIYGDECE